MLASSEKNAAIDAFLMALMTTPYSDITLRDVAARADLSLAKLAMDVSSKLDLIEGFAHRIDETVLAGDDPDMGDEPVRERLFDVMMRRYDALLPHKLALLQLERDARRDPLLAMALARIAGQSMRRMALGADIDLDGPQGALVLAGLMRLHMQVIRVWLNEDDDGQARTMAELDKALRQAERRMADVESVSKMMRGEGGPTGGPLCRLRARMDARRAASNAGRDDASHNDAAQAA